MIFFISTSTTNVGPFDLVRDWLSSMKQRVCSNWIHEKNQRDHPGILLYAVAKSDAIVVLLPGGPGTHLELGFAMAEKKKIFLAALSKDQLDSCIFYKHHSIESVVCENGLKPLFSRIEEYIEDQQ